MALQTANTNIAKWFLTSSTYAINRHFNKIFTKEQEQLIIDCGFNFSKLIMSLSYK